MFTVRLGKKSSKSFTNSLIENYLWELDWQVKENANMSYSFQGMRNYLNNEAIKKYYLTKIYPAHIARAHKQGHFHLHDLGELASYCVGWDLQDILRRGFTGVPGKVTCKPPKHLSSALGQLVNFFYTLTGEAAGAQAISNFDTFLAPFVYYDELSYDQVKQEIQSFVYNLNIPTRVGFQTPFTNITLDLQCPKMFADESAIIGGKLMQKSYGEFQAEMDMINRAFAEVMAEGDGNGRLFTFPIPTYNITKEFDWDNPNLEAVWEMTAKYGIPYFANYVNSEMDPEDARSMCCRLRLDNRVLRSRGGGLFGSNPLTGSIGVVTLNLPRIGFKLRNQNKNISKLYNAIDKWMDLAKDSLEIKRDLIEHYTEHGLYPYSKYYLEIVKKKSGKYWGNHFSTIGLIGMNEFLLNYNGSDITKPEGIELAGTILEHMRERLEKYQEETGNMYNLEATPGEGTSYRLALLDQKKYPEMIFANDYRVKNEHAKPYYTNSTQLPVNYTQDIFEALDLQDSLQTKYTGGTVLHGFLGERITESTAAKRLVQKVTSIYHLPYFSITPTFSICHTHGYQVGEHKLCPVCSTKCEVYSRVVGYIRPVDQWNEGKREEYSDRNVFVLEQDNQRMF